MGQMKLQDTKKPAGATAGFKEMYDLYRKDVFAISLAILRDADLAEDVMQEVFIKFFQYMKQNEIGNVKGWLVSVTRNMALDLYRRKKRELTGFDNDYFEKANVQFNDPAGSLVLQKYLELLDENERQIVIMKDISGMKHREIAKAMGMPLGTVLWKYRGALKKLQKGLEGY